MGWNWSEPGSADSFVSLYISLKFCRKNKHLTKTYKQVEKIPTHSKGALELSGPRHQAPHLFDEPDLFRPGVQMSHDQVSLECAIKVVVRSICALALVIPKLDT